MKYNPYICFNGNAEKAINKYAKAFKGETRILKFKDMPPNPGFEVTKELEEQVLHGMLTAENITIMVSDTIPGMPVIQGNNVGIFITFDSKEDLNFAFDVLKDNAKITMQPQETFFAKWYAGFEDEFGTPWQFGFETN